MRERNEKYFGLLARSIGIKCRLLMYTVYIECERYFRNNCDGDEDCRFLDDLVQ